MKNVFFALIAICISGTAMASDSSACKTAAEKQALRLYQEGKTAKAPACYHETSFKVSPIDVSSCSNMEKLRYRLWREGKGGPNPPACVKGGSFKVKGTSLANCTAREKLQIRIALEKGTNNFPACYYQR